MLRQCFSVCKPECNRSAFRFIILVKMQIHENLRTIKSEYLEMWPKFSNTLCSAGDLDMCEKPRTNVLRI